MPVLLSSRPPVLSVLLILVVRWYRPTVLRSSRPTVPPLSSSRPLVLSSSSSRRCLRPALAPPTSRVRSVVAGAPCGRGSSALPKGGHSLCERASGRSAQGWPDVPLATKGSAPPHSYHRRWVMWYVCMYDKGASLNTPAIRPAGCRRKKRRLLHLAGYVGAWG